MARRKTTEAIRHDGWKNLLTSVGVANRDPGVSTIFSGPTLGYEALYENLYRGDANARKIVDLPAREMTREWFDVDGDADGAITGALEEIGAKAAIRTGIRQGRLHGGALVVMLLDDGREWDRPVSMALLRRVRGFQVYSRWRVHVRRTYRVEREPNFEQPETYEITPLTGRRSFVVHESRVLRFEGAEVGEAGRRENQGWGDSVLTAIWPQLRNVGAVDAYSVGVVRDFVQGVMTVTNLGNMIASGRENEVIRRLDIIDQTRSILNTILLDKDETYTKISSNVSGLEGLIDRHREGLAAAVEMPMTLLWGRPPAGLSTDDEAGTRNWYDRIAGEQEDRLQPPLERLVRYMQLAKDGPMRGRELKSWSIKFRPLFQLTEAEEVDLRAKRAEMDATYIDRGVLDPEEVRESRFGSGKYAGEIKLMPREPRDPEPIGGGGDDTESDEDAGKDDQGGEEAAA